jgi:hypothetical protein
MGPEARPTWWDTWEKLGYQQDLVRARKVYNSNELSEEEKGKLFGQILQQKEEDEAEYQLAGVLDEL